MERMKSHISDIKLYAKNGLSECTLNNLGKMNVICGKNNSGKSTVLLAISQLYSRSFGKTLSYSEFENVYILGCYLFISLKNREQALSNNLRVKEKEEFLKKIYNECIKNKVLYSDEEELFTAKRRSIWYESEFADDYNERIEERIFRDFFRSEPSQIQLISPRRKLELKSEFSNEDTISSEGKGILKKIFYAKNQNIGSVLRSNYEELRNAFKDISGGYAFDISMSGLIIQLSFKSNNNEWIEAASCGIGLHDLMILLYFAIFSEENVLLLEEPESHMHPDMQRKLLQYLVNKTHKQYFITTHSNIFLNTNFVDKIFYTQCLETIHVTDETNRSEILHNLGYSVNDNLIVDLVILTEGPNDRIALECFLSKLDLLGKYDIKIWALGGDIMDKHDLSVFAQSHNVMALIDKDTKSKAIRDRFIENCEEYGVYVHRLERYAMENYYPLRVLKDIFKGQVSDSITEIKPEIKLESQIGLDVKKNTKKIVSQMTIDDIIETDLMVFFNKVQDECLKKLVENRI